MDDQPLVFSFPNSRHTDTPAAPPPPQQPAPQQPAQQQGQQPFAAFVEKPKPPGSALGDGVPEPLRELREQRRQEFPFYDETKDYQDSGLEEMADAVGLVGEEREMAVGESKRIFADYGLNGNEAREIVSLISQYGNEPPDEATAAAWKAESWSALVRQHGAKEANAMLADAQKFVAINPAVKETLDLTRLGNHPKVVARVVSLARSEKARGRLK